MYQKALDDAGYKYILKYQPQTTPKKKCRSRKVIYFNPPYSNTVKTNVIKMFLSLVSKHFPKGHKLNKCFNQNTVKATYCTLPNMKDRISKHNAKILSLEKNAEGKIKCNCRNKTTCPIPGECNQTNVVYQAEIHANNKKMKYFGSTENFKSRYAQHKSSIKNRPSNHKTLSSYI